MKISEEQYEEYQSLKKWAEKEKVFQSAKQITKLEDDIDFPIKKCVAMLALLGCKPLYSCCGFDYEGQPYHKSHQYGRPYFILTASESTFNFIDFLRRNRTLWYASQGANSSVVNIELMAGANPHWRKEECIHFSEECVINIYRMEKILERAKDFMADEADLMDSNEGAKKEIKYWRYPPKEPWRILKKDLFEANG